VKWILLVVVMTTNGAAVTNAEYDSLEKCMAAGRNFQAATANDGWRTSWSCNPK